MRQNTVQWAVGKTNGEGKISYFNTLAQAEAEIERIEETDPVAVHAGDYYIDGPIEA